MAKNLKPPLYTVTSDEQLVWRLLSRKQGMPEEDLKAILMNEYGWTERHVTHAVTEAFVAKVIRWVAYDGWYRHRKPV